MDPSGALQPCEVSQAELRRQIAALQAQLKDVSSPLTPAKRKQEPKVIAASTPSPKKRKLESNHPSKNPNQQGRNNPLQLSKSNLKQQQAKPLGPPELPPLQPSKLLSNLASIHSHSKVATEAIERSIGFSEAPARQVQTQPLVPERDDRLALVEKLTPGPLDHPPPVDDPHFERLEPNSGIHLSSRRLPHTDLQEHLRGRYYLSPSLLYSVIRPLPSNQGYDVPVPGDWVTIAVIAEMGPIKLTSTSSTIHADDDARPSNGKDGTGKGKQKVEPEDKKMRGKKYMSLKLVDFGTRSRTSSATPKAQIRGDALLTLLLFEADSHSFVEDENRAKGCKTERTKVYKGGSGGAFEACMKLHEGAVVAILNPKVLKPYQRNSSAPHPTTNILAITPTSAQSIAIIGRSRDLGMCGATKRDGKVCGSWCDKRISDCCEYHVEHAVQRKRAGRAEFSIGTSGMTTTAHIRKPAFDPERKWGLLPADGGSRSGAESASTYVIPGHVISGSGPEYVGEKIGRGREEKAKRRREEKETDAMLNRLLGRDGGGAGDRNAAAGAVRRAREVMKSLKGEKTRAKDKGKECRKSAYSAEAIKRLGFDPVSKSVQESNAGDVKRKLEVLASLQRDRGDIILRPRPGKRIRSGVSVPIAAVSELPEIDGCSGDEGEETGEARTLEPAVMARAHGVEESDDELEIEA
ncbi:hypothetical protein K439DRAFT_1412151 [Ramaria rubella]|nr:hypothetical protein K439DRAFT_1412151 [Ramaria rubella]